MIPGRAISHVKRAMLQAVEAANTLFRHARIHLSRDGLRVWEYAPKT